MSDSSPSQEQRAHAPENHACWSSLVGVRDRFGFLNASEARDPQRRDLAHLGFPLDWWLPFEFARRWHSEIFPLHATEESVQRYRKLMGLVAAKARIAACEGDVKRVTDNARIELRFINDLEHDLELLRQYDPKLVEPPIKNNTDRGDLGKEIEQLLKRLIEEAVAGSRQDPHEPGAALHEVKALGSSANRKRELPRVPNPDAWKAWMQQMLGKNQEEIAAILTQRLKKPVDQSKVSRWLARR